MDHLLICECGQENIVSRKQAGQQVVCGCGKLLNVPTLRGFAELPRSAQAQPSGSKSSAEVAKSAWAGWKGPAFALAMCVFLIAGITAAYNLLLRSSIDTSYNVDKFIEQGDEVYNTYSAVELSLTWQEFEKLTLGPKMTPTFVFMNDKAKELQRYAAVSGAVALLSALVAGGIWTMARTGKS